jgi:hypothetical protein
MITPWELGLAAWMERKDGVLGQRRRGEASSKAALLLGEQPLKSHAMRWKDSLFRHESVQVYADVFVCSKWFVEGIFLSQ